MSLPELESDEEYCEDCEAVLGSDDCAHCSCSPDNKKVHGRDHCEDCI